jgi:hypothetical protein
MDMWSAIVLIVIAGLVFDAYETRMKARSFRTKHDETVGGLADRVSRLEERIANLETLVLEQDKRREFDALSRER